MDAWRGGMVVGLLVVGCGGALPEQAPELEGPTASLEAVAPGGSKAGAVTSAWCVPDAEDTQRVATLIPPTQGVPRFAPTPESLVDFQGTLHFAINREDGVTGLWKSDGTEAGTVAVKEFPATPGATELPWVGNLTPANEQLFFEATDPVHGRELWVSNGASTGTHLVRDLTPGAEGSTLSHLTALGSTVVFFRENLTAPRFELWRSDGTTVGTVQVGTLDAEAWVSWRDARVGGALLFFATDARGLALWRTDGTVSGTMRLKLLDAGPDSASVFDVSTDGSHAYFTLDETDGSTEVWKTDGTAAGTVRLDTFGPTRPARILGPLGGSLLVTATSVSDQRMTLYRMGLEDGAQTRIVTLPNDYASEGEAFPYPYAAATAGGKLFFTVTIGSGGPGIRDTQLWVTDGTSAGTQLLRRPLSLSDEYNAPLLAVSDDLVFFSAYEPATGLEPWVTDGTVGGTRELKDLAPATAGSSSYPSAFTRVGNRVFFGAFDETRAGQLWSTRLQDTCSALARSPQR